MSGPSTGAVATGPGVGAPRRIVAIADTDSYVKWAAALVGTLEAWLDASLLVL